MPVVPTVAPQLTVSPELQPPVKPPEPSTVPIAVTINPGTSLLSIPSASSALNRSKSARLVFTVPLRQGARETWVAPKVDYTVERMADAAWIGDDNTHYTERGEAWVSWWTDTDKEEIPAPASPGVSQGAPSGSRTLYISIAARGNTTLTVRSVGGTVRYER